MLYRNAMSPCTMGRLSGVFGERTSLMRNGLTRRHLRAAKRPCQLRQGKDFGPQA